MATSVQARPIQIALSITRDDKVIEYQFTVDPDDRGNANIDLESLFKDRDDGRIIRSEPTGLVNFNLELRNARIV